MNAIHKTYYVTAIAIVALVSFMGGRVSNDGLATERERELRICYDIGTKTIIELQETLVKKNVMMERLVDSCEKVKAELDRANKTSRHQFTPTVEGKQGFYTNDSD